MSRLINYQIKLTNINEFPAKLIEYAGREVKTHEIWSISFNFQVSDIYCFVSLFDSSINPLNKEFAL